MAKYLALPAQNRERFDPFLGIESVPNQVKFIAERRELLLPSHQGCIGICNHRARPSRYDTLQPPVHSLLGRRSMLNCEFIGKRIPAVSDPCKFIAPG
jgi:hypothetical protein